MRILKHSRRILRDPWYSWRARGVVDHGPQGLRSLGLARLVSIEECPRAGISASCLPRLLPACRR